MSHLSSHMEGLGCIFSSNHHELCVVYFFTYEVPHLHAFLVYSRPSLYGSARRSPNVIACFFQRCDLRHQNLSHVSDFCLDLDFFCFYFTFLFFIYISLRSSVHCHFTRPSVLLASFIEVKNLPILSDAGLCQSLVTLLVNRENTSLWVVGACRFVVLPQRLSIFVLKIGLVNLCLFLFNKINLRAFFRLSQLLVSLNTCFYCWSDIF